MNSIEELNVYNLSMVLGEKIWKIVNGWNFFERDTIGKQLVRSTDSISANLSEGFGRFHYLENKNFCYYSRGSLYETKTWLTKANERKLINKEDYHLFLNDIDVLGKMLNNYINSIGKQRNNQ